MPKTLSMNRATSFDKKNFTVRFVFTNPVIPAPLSQFPPYKKHGPYLSPESVNNIFSPEFVQSEMVDKGAVFTLIRDEPKNFRRIFVDFVSVSAFHGISRFDLNNHDNNREVKRWKN